MYKVCFITQNVVPLAELCVLLLLDGVFERWVSGSNWLIVLFLIFCLLLCSVTEKGVNASKYNCGFVYSTFQIYYFFFHVFWRSLLCEFIFNTHLHGEQWLSQTSREKMEDLCNLDVGKQVWNIATKSTGHKLKNMWRELYKN